MTLRAEMTTPPPEQTRDFRMKLAIALTISLIASPCASMAGTATASQRAYKQGYSDCWQGRYDLNQHSASYRKGCDAAAFADSTTFLNTMLDKCHAHAIATYRASAEVITLKYRGQRRDGTHLVNGLVIGSESSATFQCFLDRTGWRIVKFTPLSSTADAMSYQ